MNSCSRHVSPTHQQPLTQRPHIVGIDIIKIINYGSEGITQCADSAVSGLDQSEHPINIV
jgi:hypothetical protein